MSRRIHEAAVSAGLAMVMGVPLGMALGNLSMGLAIGAVLPLTGAAERCRRGS